MMGYVTRQRSDALASAALPRRAVMCAPALRAARSACRAAARWGPGHAYMKWAELAAGDLTSVRRRLGRGSWTIGLTRTTPPRLPASVRDIGPLLTEYP